jgi:hypothetical protein
MSHSNWNPHGNGQGWAQPSGHAPGQPHGVQSQHAQQQPYAQQQPVTQHAQHQPYAQQQAYPQQPYPQPQPYPQQPHPQQPYPQQPYPQPQPYQQQPHPQQPDPPPQPPTEERVALADRPGDAAEEMFKDDPVMLALIKANRARPDPVRKPALWLVTHGVCMVGVAALLQIVSFTLGGGFSEELVATGMISGAAGFVGLFGYRPGTFEEVGTGKRMYLWIPQAWWARVLYLLLAAVAAPLGFVLWWLG